MWWYQYGSFFFGQNVNWRQRICFDVSEFKKSWFKNVYSFLLYRSDLSQTSLFVSSAWLFLQAYQTCHLKNTSTFPYPCNLDEEFNFNVNSKDVAHKIMMMIGEIKTVSNCLRFSSKDKLEVLRNLHIWQDMLQINNCLRHQGRVLNVTSKLRLTKLSWLDYFASDF